MPASVASLQLLRLPCPGLQETCCQIPWLCSLTEYWAVLESPGMASFLQVRQGSNPLNCPSQPAAGDISGRDGQAAARGHLEWPQGQAEMGKS